MERGWVFGEQRPDLKLEKKNIPENCLLYINQSYLSTVKNEDLAMYNHNFIIGQLLPAANQPDDIGSYERTKRSQTVYLHI